MVDHNASDVGQFNDLMHRFLTRIDAIEYGQQRRQQDQLNVLTNNLSLVRAQISSLNSKVGIQNPLASQAPTAPPPVVSHRGPGAVVANQPDSPASEATEPGAR